MTIETCALCPRLCRTSCPVATGSFREAAVPTRIADVLVDYEAGRVDAELAAQAVALCANCGACQDRCHKHLPLPAAIAQAQRQLLKPPPIELLQPLEGEGDVVAVESDDRPLARVVSRLLGASVRRWPTGDRLGADSIGYPAFDGHAREIQLHVGQARVVAHDGGVVAALRAAGVSVTWLHELVPDAPRGCGSCVAEGPKPMACCGGAGAVAVHAPEEANRVGAFWLDRAEAWTTVDARCRNHLRAHSDKVTDFLDVLMEAADAQPG